MKVLVAVFVTLISCLSNGVLGMDCNFGTSKNIVDKFINTCPRPFVDNSDEKYCCVKNNEMSCCDIYEFIGTSIIFFLPYIIALLILSCVISCICCLCCKRGGGRVYGTVPPPTLAQRIVIIPCGGPSQQNRYVYPHEVHSITAPLINAA